MFKIDVKGVGAVPNLTLSPATATFTQGNSYDVTIGVDSGTNKTAGIDVYGTFDAAKLEISSIRKADNPAPDFSFTPISPNINNSAGKFDISFLGTDMSTYTALIMKDISLMLQSLLTSLLRSFITLLKVITLMIIL